MRWGIRKYQNPDGSLTAAGQKRYSELQDTKASKTATRKEKKSASYELKVFNKNQSQLEKANRKIGKGRRERAVNEVYANNELKMDAKSWRDSYSAGQKFVNAFRKGGNKAMSEYDALYGQNNAYKTYKKQGIDLNEAEEKVSERFIEQYLNNQYTG